MTDVTTILKAIEQGDRAAADELLCLVYDELRKLAAARMAAEAPGQTLDATALVHEAYLRLVEHERRGSCAPHWDSRGHFFGAAAEAMRRILIERARRRQTERQGGRVQRVALDAAALIQEAAPAELLELDGALDRLAEAHPQAAQLVKLRFFAGRSVDESAEILGISPRTARRTWVYARAWLRRELDRGDPAAGTG
ncbi:MAG TPA: ECF-type sigma factor [Planctomycetaceae bacterium]|nr:ECF-type sigma factor [Planctomycetaceae bacterium]